MNKIDGHTNLMWEWLDNWTAKMSVNGEHAKLPTPPETSNPVRTVTKVCKHCKETFPESHMANWDYCHACYDNLHEPEEAEGYREDA